MRVQLCSLFALLGTLAFGWSTTDAQVYPQAYGQPNTPQPQVQRVPPPNSWAGNPSAVGNPVINRVPHPGVQRQAVPQGTGVSSAAPNYAGPMTPLYGTQPQQTRVPTNAYPPQRYPLPGATPQPYQPAGVPGQPAGYGWSQDAILPPQPQPAPMLNQQPLPAPQQGPVGTENIQVPGYNNSPNSYQGNGYPQGGYGDPYLGGMSGGYAGDVYGSTSACSECGIADCMGECCEPCCRPVWFGGVYGLVMARDYESNEYLSFYGGMPSTTQLSSNDVDLGTFGGAEVAFGRHYCCGLAWQVGYWGVLSDEQVSTIYGWPDTRKYDFAYLDYTPGGYGNNNGQYWYNQAYSHEVHRQNEFHNFEINLLSFLPLCPPQPCCDPCGDMCMDSCGADACGSCGSCEPCDCGPRCSFSMFGGLRYFYFDEFFSYRATMTGWYGNDTRDMAYDLDVDNHLVGLQWGGSFNYCLCHNLTLTGGTKLGVFNNYMEHDQKIYGPSGVATINAGPWAGGQYNYSTDKSDLAFLGEFNIGLAYQFACCWRVVAGYRAMGISGIALAVNQMPDDYWYPADSTYIDSDGQLILHGGYLGLEFVH